MLKAKERINSLKTQKQKLRERIDALYIDKLDNKISEEFWLERHNKWTQDLLKIQNNITAYEKANINFIKMGVKFLKICNEVVDLYKIADNNEKRELLNYVLQNFSMNGENLSYEYKKPFDIFAKGLNRNKKLLRLFNNRTLIDELFYEITKTSSEIFALINVVLQFN